MKRLIYLLLLFCPTITFGQSEVQTLLVLNKVDHTLSFIDPVSMKPNGILKTGRGPHEVCVSDDGKLAFVANYGDQTPGNSITVVDVEQKKEVRVVDLGALWKPHGMAFKNGKLYVTSEASRTVFRYDPVANKIDWINGHGRSYAHMLALSLDGKKVYTADMFSNSVTVMSIGAPPAPEYIRHIDVGPKPEAIELSSDGKELWIGQNDDGNISIINTATNKVEQKVAIGKMPIRIKFTPDGKYVLVSDPPADEVVVLDAKTKAILHRLKVGGMPVGMILSNDSRFAYVALTGQNVVTKIDLSTFKEVGKVDTGTNPDGIALSYIRK